jgi:peptidoglycan L-alanyl-D-glutamate endopeptidase CwlK
MARSLDLLHPGVKSRALAFIGKAMDRGILIVSTRTLVTHDEQAAVYAQGLTAPGPPCTHKGVVRPVGTCITHPLGLRVSKAAPGWSFHEYGLALDIAVVRNGKVTWDGKVDVDGDKVWDYAELGPIGESCGLEWGGRWTTMVDYPHYQVSFGLTIEDLRAGVSPPQ